jgi:predicted lactoylglutathione lyase
MLGYVTIGSNDLKRSYAFFDAVFEPLGGKRLIEGDRSVIYGVKRPSIMVCTPYDEGQATSGNGAMTALAARSRDQVDAVHARALEMGATCDGPPGVRGDDPNGFYGAYFRDLDGNKFCAYRFGPPDA